MSGIVGVNTAKNSGILAAHIYAVGQSCEIKTQNSVVTPGVQNYPFKLNGVTEVSNSNTSLFTADTVNDYGITLHYPGRYFGFHQVYFTTPSAQGYSESQIAVWNGSSYDGAVGNSYRINYREHSGSSRWLTVNSSAIFDGIAGKTYGLYVSVSSGTVQINGGHTRLLLTYLGHDYGDHYQ